jgi:hypothetical protein
VAHRSSGRRRLYASWNGATDVVAWHLEAGPRPGELHGVLTRPKRGFETSLPVPEGGPVVAAVAIGRHGRVLGRSKAVRL